MNIFLKICVTWLLLISAAQAVEVSKVPGMEIELGSTEVIVPGRQYVSMFKLSIGDLIVGNQRSSDGGKIWQPAAVGFGRNSCQLPDGEILSLGFQTAPADRPGVFKVSMIVSRDQAKTKAVETALLNIPEGTGGTDDCGKPFPGPVCDHAIVALRDGSLLAAMYGYFKTDTVLCPTFAKWKLYKYRTFVIRSTDRGRTWDYLATVAYDPTVGLESFCEPDLLVLPGGDVLCFMRTGGSGGKYTPLYLSRSTDDGRSWSKPLPIADRGVWPTACRMHSGVLVCTYGRPDNWLAFSLDEGKTWVGHFCFYRGPTTSYNSVAEVAPDTLLVVYDRRGNASDGKPQPETVGLRVTVKRTDGCTAHGKEAPCQTSNR